jgi:hypothetical protein
MITLRGILPLALAAVVVAPHALAASTASGTVRVDHADFAVADAIAYPEGDSLRVVLASGALDREAMLADGGIDVFDLMRQKVDTLTLELGADGPAMCVHVHSRDGDTQYSGSSCNSEYPDTIRIDARDDSRVAGAMRWGEAGGRHVHVAFDLPILPGAQAAATSRLDGTRLPADGGEPGKAMQAHFAALAAGDWAAFKAIAHPDRREMMDASEQAGEHLEMFEFLRAFAPENLRVTGGTVAGDQAEVDFSGESDGSPVRGYAELTRVDGRWYYLGMTTED